MDFGLCDIMVGFPISSHIWKVTEGSAIGYAKQKHLGCKKLRGQSEAAIKWLYMQPNVWYLAKAKNYTKYRYVTYWYWKCCMHLPLFKNVNKNIYDLIIQLQSFKGYSHNLIWLALSLGHLLYVAGFAKRGLPHTSNLSTLIDHNLLWQGPTVYCKSFKVEKFRGCMG